MDKHTVDIFIFVIGCLFVTFSLVTKTKNLLSSLLFNVFPFFSGLFIAIYSLYNAGLFN